MNRVFFYLVAVAFAFAAVRECVYLVPTDGLVLYHGFSAHPGETWLLHAPTVAWLKDLAHFTVKDGAALAPMDEVTNAVFDKAKASVLDVAFPLIGGMTLFLGLMKIVEQGGGLQLMARLIRPILVKLFPDVPANHPAMGAMIMNLAANALGLGNAATPFGIKAMHELDKLNPHKGTATNAMALFLTINTSSVTVLATGVIVMRRALGSHDAGAVQITTLFATLCSSILGAAACIAMSRWSASPPATDPIDTSVSEDTDDGYPLWVSVAVIGAFLGLVVVGMPLSALHHPAIVKEFTTWLIPSLVIGFLGFGYARGVPVYESFIVGAREGFDIAVKIIPYLVGILVAVGMFTSSGALHAFAGLIGPITSLVGLPPEALPMAMIRPLSGSGATGVMMATMNEPATGPDTYVGYLVSTIAGSSETTFYVLSVYYGAIGIKNVRHTLPAALLADVFGLIGSIIAVQAYFRLILHATP